uniref:Putative secreted protein n=1 Tax=Anopheles darlingi TaxID=43151 RepID=A0A2M4D3Q7_ANODA
MVLLLLLVTATLLALGRQVRARWCRGVARITPGSRRCRRFDVKVLGVDRMRCRFARYRTGHHIRPHLRCYLVQFRRHRYGWCRRWYCWRQ